MVSTADRHPQQTSCGDDVDIGTFLCEIFQRGQGLLAVLDLIENDERPARLDFRAPVVLERLEDGARPHVPFDFPDDVPIDFQRDVDVGLVCGSSELDQRVGLPDLTRTEDDGGQVAGAVLPGGQRLFDFPEQLHHLRSMIS